MEFIREILMSLTVVSIFSGIVIKLSDENEVVKIACSMLMIIAIITPFNKKIDFSEFEIGLKTYSQENLYKTEIEFDIIEKTLEEYLIENGNIIAKISIDESYNIQKVITENETDIEKISELLGINADKIEYIKSR